MARKIILESSVLLVVIFVSLMFGFVAPLSAHSQDNPQGQVQNGTDDLQRAPWESFQQKTGIGAGYLKNTDAEPLTIGQVVFRVYSGALALLGTIFLILMVYSGFRWMTAGGKAEVIEKSGETIRHAIIGFAITVGAYAISMFVLNVILGGNSVGLGFGGTAFAQEIISNSLKDEIYTGLGEAATGEFGIQNPPVSPIIIVIRVINGLIALLGIIFLVLIVIAGYMYMTAGGQSEKTEKAVSYIKRAVIGLIIILMSYSITNFVFWVIARGTNDRNAPLIQFVTQWWKKD